MKNIPLIEAAHQYFGMPPDFPHRTNMEYQAPFFAGAAYGALAARMSQEEILKAVREASAPATIAPEYSALFDAAMALNNISSADDKTPELLALRDALLALRDALAKGTRL